jgi:dTDP-glucose pyrophosphorylase
MSILGVIPAAGQGSRWGGFYKELLPCGNGDFLINHTIRTMTYGGADSILIVSNPTKISTHTTHLSDLGKLPLSYMMQKGENDIYSAIETTLPVAEELNYFAMPDTFLDYTTFTHDFDYADFYLGTFTTTTPERFGVLVEDQVVNKSDKLEEKELYDAWGVLVWTKDVADFWLNVEPQDYTDAINKAMKVFTWDTFPLSYYFDMASWEDYRRFLEWIN